MEAPGDLLTLKEVAHRLKVSERQVRELVHQRRLVRPVKLGKANRWFAQDVASYEWLLARGFFEAPAKAGES